MSYLFLVLFFLVLPPARPLLSRSFLPSPSPSPSPPSSPPSPLPLPPPPLQSPTPATSLTCPFGPPDCSGHGAPVPPCECRCDKGWLTAATQDLSDYKYCGVSSAATPAPTPVASPSTFRLELSRSASFLTREREEREREKKKTGVARFFRNPKKKRFLFFMRQPPRPPRPAPAASSFRSSGSSSR